MESSLNAAAPTGDTPNTPAVPSVNATPQGAQENASLPSSSTSAIPLTAAPGTFATNDASATNTGPADAAQTHTSLGSSAANGTNSTLPPPPSVQEPQTRDETYGSNATSSSTIPLDSTALGSAAEQSSHAPNTDESKALSNVTALNTAPNTALNTVLNAAQSSFQTSQDTQQPAALEKAPRTAAQERTQSTGDLPVSNEAENSHKPEEQREPAALSGILNRQTLPSIQSFQMHEDNGEKVVLPGIDKGYALPPLESHFNGQHNFNEKQVPHLPALKQHFEGQIQLPRLPSNLPNAGQYGGLPLPMMQYKQEESSSTANQAGPGNPANGGQPNPAPNAGKTNSASQPPANSAVPNQSPAAQPAQTQPAQPAQPQLVQPQPVQPQPVQSQPVQPQPVQPQPVQPQQAQPVQPAAAQSQSPVPNASSQPGNQHVHQHMHPRVHSTTPIPAPQPANIPSLQQVLPPNHIPMQMMPSQAQQTPPQQPHRLPQQPIPPQQQPIHHLPQAQQPPRQTQVPQPQPQVQPPPKQHPHHISQIPQPQQLMMGYMPMYPYAPQQFSPASQIAYMSQPPMPPGMPPAAAAALNGVTGMPGVSNPGEYRPLNVKDALTYLEQVKLHFANQPDVYNHFLDIMKDFKSHNIDTPGVIDRVSSLFRGHANLIQGFNTFLPAGYSIICSTDPNDPHPIRVTTPMGTQTLPQLLPRKQSQPQQQPPQPPQQPPQPPQQPQQPPQQPQQPQQPQPPMQPAQPPQPVHTARAQTSPHAQAVPQPQPHASVPQPQSQSDRPYYIPTMQVDRSTGGPVEFSHAISYVNRIKNHFSSQPEIYKQFLEILQTYQREQLRISEVYSQVRELFQDAPDLLEGFRNFLPDADAEAEDLRLPPIGSFGPSDAKGPSFGNFGPRSDQQQLANQHQIANPHAPNQAQSANIANQLSSHYPQQFMPHPNQHQLQQQYDDRAAKNAENSNEIAFFEKVKKILPKDTYHELLKILNLFTQRIIDVPTLVKHVTPFFDGQKELLDWFTNFIGFDGEPLHIENIAQRKHVIDLSKCRAYGRSYRMLPKTEKFMPCSGRDELCWEVLNDEWVGHPTWASEDSGYIAHRKNQYEEILHRVEEERHEYDHYIGANQRTIQVLETIDDRISRMSSEEAANFTLPEGLGHGNKIYQKVIRKIYDKKNGAEVIRALHETPTAAVPVVLRRLKQKDEEWSRAHREWNKVWREAERKAFYKSLDHVGLTFKQADRKYLTPRSLLAEIMVVKTEQGAKRKLASTNLAPLPPPRSQIDALFDDREVIEDLRDLVLRYINARPIMSIADKERARKFLTAFVDELFATGPIEEKIHLLGKKSSDPDFRRRGRADKESAESKAPEENEAESVADSDKMVADDKVVKSDADNETKSDTLPGAKENAKEDVKEDAKESAKDGAKDGVVASEMEVDDPSWLKLDKGTINLDKKAPRNHYNLFANTPIYLFLRIFQILYVRLREVKSVEPIVSKTLAESKKTQFAIDLGLYDTKLESLGLQFDSKDVYKQTLQLCRRVIDDDVEPQWFEEALRQAYRNRAYKLYTIDKALQSLIKYLHAIIVDDKCLDALSLWEADRAQPETDLRTQIELRAASRRIYRGTDQPDPSDPLFRICWVPEKSLLTFQSLGPFDLSLKDARHNWEYYVTSYTMSLPTEGVPLNKLHAPFLQRTLNLTDHEQGFTALKDGLEAEIAVNSYKLDFRPGTTDVIVKTITQNDSSAGKKLRSERWTKTLESAEAALIENEKETLESRMDVDGAEDSGVAPQSALPGRTADDTDELPDQDATDELTDPMETDDATEDAMQDATQDDVVGNSDSYPTSSMLLAQPSHGVMPVEIVIPKKVETPSS